MNRKKCAATVEKQNPERSVGAVLSGFNVYKKEERVRMKLRQY